MEQVRLLKKAVGLKEAYGQAMAVTAPLGSVVSTTTAAVAYAGGGVILATLMALLASALWIYTLTRYSDKIASAGGFYSFSSAAWRNKKVSFFEAFTEVGAYVLLNAANVLAVITILESVSSFGIRIPSTLLWGVAIALSFYPSIISFMNVRKLLGTIVTVSGTAEAVLLGSLFIYDIIYKGFNPSLFFDVRDLSAGGLAVAFVLTVVSISGAGASTYLGEESKTPTKTISKGMWLSLAIGGFAMVLGTYALVDLWNGSLSSLSTAKQPLFTEVLGISSIALFITVFLSINSLMASNIGTTLGASRIIFNMAREKSAPGIFTRLSDQRQPIFALLCIGSVTALLSLGLSLFEGFYNAFLDISAITGIFWISGRLIDSLGVPVFLRRIGSLSYASVVIPVVVSVINFAGVAVSFSGFDTVQIVIISVMYVLMALWYVLLGRNSNVGSILVDEEGELIERDEVIRRLQKNVNPSVR